MANLRLAMDSNFWDLNISTPQTLDGTARLVPGEPVPLDGARASRALRAQQLSLLSNGFPLGIIPSYFPTSQKELGSFSLQSMLFRPATSNWWLGLIAQFRPKKLISSIKAEVFSGDELELPAFKDVAKHFLDKSLYSLGLCTQLSLSSASSLLLSTEVHGERKGRRTKAMFFHKLPQHDITLEAAWPELFIDRKGGYWDVPESISLDLSSLVSESGLRYRFGVHKSSGHPKAFNTTSDEPPIALMPGLCAKAGFSYEKNRDIWRQKERQEDVTIQTVKARYLRPSYDVRLKEPHAAISGILGGTCTTWFGGNESSVAVNSVGQSEGGEAIISSTLPRSPFSADLYGSVCYTLQHGKFRKPYGDLTRVDTRLNICSASAFARGAAHIVSNVFKSLPVKSEVNPLASPKLNVILQQQTMALVMYEDYLHRNGRMESTILSSLPLHLQVAGPIVFRVDSQFSLDSSSGKFGPHIDDVMYSLNYSLRLLRSGKVVAWYSPKRKEGMIELRLFEF